MPTKKKVDTTKKDTQSVKRAEEAEVLLFFVEDFRKEKETEVLNNLYSNPEQDVVRVQAEYRAYRDMEVYLKRKIAEGVIARDRMEKEKKANG